MESSPQIQSGYSVNPSFEGFDSSPVDLLFEQLNLPDTAWGPFEVEPKKDGEPLAWMRRKLDNQVSTLVYMRIRKIYPTIPPAKLQSILGDPNVRAQWDEQPVFKIVNEDTSTHSYIIH